MTAVAVVPLVGAATQEYPVGPTLMRVLLTHSEVDVALGDDQAADFQDEVGVVGGDVAGADGGAVQLAI